MMIGALCQSSEASIVEEFFQLFKTPWEYYAPGRTYDLVIATSKDIPENLTSRVLVIYNSRAVEFDSYIGVTTEPVGATLEWLNFHGADFPVYGSVAVLRSCERELVTLREGGGVVAGVVGSSGPPTVRIGLDLFYEVAFLLSQGQPPENALIATLEIHISLLREIMVDFGIAFVELPPVPAGYDFAACLTHDVDFVGIRNHKFDHTMWGFVYRCFIGSLLDTLKGRLSLKKCWRNWVAGLSLPLVFFGILDDYWLEFDRYKGIEKGLGSTFFFIPFPNVPGRFESGTAPSRRAAKYDVADIQNELRELVNDGCEVGVHGIDAWHDLENGRQELDRIQGLTGQGKLGTRTHWLCWKETSPQLIEDAGFDYDSTVGYNDAAGFRAGTTQVFRPLAAKQLLELPLNIMDSALFYRGRMSLSEEEAFNVSKTVIRSFLRFGGVLTINWHTRSLSPERLWGDFYATLLSELQASRVWFGTAQMMVDWFRQRRAISFGSIQLDEAGIDVGLTAKPGHHGASFTVRLYHPMFSADMSQPSYVDAEWNGHDRVFIPLPQLAN